MSEPPITKATPAVSNQPPEAYNSYPPPQNYGLAPQYYQGQYQNQPNYPSSNPQYPPAAYGAAYNQPPAPQTAYGAAYNQPPAAYMPSYNQTPQAQSAYSQPPAPQTAYGAAYSHPLSYNNQVYQGYSGQYNTPAYNQQPVYTNKPAHKNPQIHTLQAASPAVQPNILPQHEPAPIRNMSFKERLTSFHSEIMITQQNNRKNFITKVYAILSMQLFFTVLWTGIVVGIQELREGIRETFPIVIVCFIITIILMIALFCGKKFAKKYPRNMIALAIFTVCQTYIIAFISASYDPLMVLVAALITFAITVGLTIYAWKTRRDFTTCGGVMVVSLIAVLLFCFFLIFFFGQVVTLIVLLIIVMLYGFFIVYDTQLIAGGRYAQLNYDDYVLGALFLYVDIIGLFLYILAIMGRKN